MFPDDVARQPPRALLAPFQGAVRVSWALSGGFTTGSFLACLWHGRFGGCAVIGDLKRFCMASAHLSLHYHLVFSTRNREPWLSPTHRQRVHFIHRRYPPKHGRRGPCGGRNGRSPPHRGGIGATHCLADVMREVKSESSRWIHEELRLAGFAFCSSEFASRLRADSESAPSRNRNSALLPLAERLRCFFRKPVQRGRGA